MTPWIETRSSLVYLYSSCGIESWVGLGWVGLGWVGLGWVGLGWVGFGWVGLGWVGLYDTYEILDRCSAMSLYMQLAREGPKGSATKSPIQAEIAEEGLGQKGCDVMGA